MSTKKKMLLKKKFVKRNIRVYKSSRKEMFKLLKWKDNIKLKNNLAIIHSFSDTMNTTFIDGYFSYHLHFMFFEITSESEWHPDSRQSARITYDFKKYNYKSMKYAHHYFRVFTRLKSITPNYMFTVLKFIETWIDKNENLIIDAENHFTRLQHQSLVLADEIIDTWINTTVGVQAISSAPKTPDSDANSEEKMEASNVDTNDSIDKSNQKD